MQRLWMEYQCGALFKAVLDTFKTDFSVLHSKGKIVHCGYYTSLLVIIITTLTIMLRHAVSVKPRPTIRAVLIDLSGTVHVATQPTPGSPDAIQRLRDSSMPFRFCSNTSKESTAELCDKLARMGIETRDNEVWTSIGAVNSLLREKGARRCVLLIRTYHPCEMAKTHAGRSS